MDQGADDRIPSPAATTGLVQPVLGTVLPRFAGIPTFMRLPLVDDPAKVDLALVGVPWDGGTTNRPGARHGPREMRNQSTLMRRIHPVSGISPFALARIGDLGDVAINPCDPADSLGRIERFFAALHGAGAVPLAAGGDHLITLPILRAIARGRPLGLIHFDAHSDTGDRYFGDTRFTHGTPFRRAIEEGLIDPQRMIQIGIRGSLYAADDLAWPRQVGVRIVTIEEYFRVGWERVMAEARRLVGDGPVYLSFDVDGLDPVYAPGTGTPEIGGYSTFEAQQMIRACRGLDLVGADVVEVAPPLDPSGNTALVGATLMFEILCPLAEARAKRKAR